MEEVKEIDELSREELIVKMEEHREAFKAMEERLTQVREQYKKQKKLLANYVGQHDGLVEKSAEMSRELVALRQELASVKRERDALQVCVRTQEGHITFLTDKCKSSDDEVSRLGEIARSLREQLRIAEGSSRRRGILGRLFGRDNEGQELV